jgi:hypothetical protein
MSKIAAALKEWRCDVVHLDFSNVGMSKTGIKELLSALTQNPNVTNTLEFFSIANNKVQAQNLQRLYTHTHFSLQLKEFTVFLCHF